MKKLQNASKIKDSHFNNFDDFSGLRWHTKSGLTILEMAICTVVYPFIFMFVKIFVRIVIDLQRHIFRRKFKESSSEYVYSI